MQQKRAVIYTRISYDRLLGKEDEGRGVARQLKECRELAEQRGYDVVRVFQDNNVSASNTKKARHEFLAMLEHLRSGEVDVLIAWHQDRLYRMLSDLEKLIDAADVHKVEILVRQGREDGESLNLDSVNGRMNARITGIVARQEVEQRVERIKARQRQNAADGIRKVGGLRPFGYDEIRDDTGKVTGYKPDHVEAPLLRDAIERIVENPADTSLRSIWMVWNRDGVRTVAGKLWHYQSFRTLLLRPTNGGIGYVTPVGGTDRMEILLKGKFIVEPATQRQLMKILTNPDRKRQKVWKPASLCSGLVVCGNCGSTMQNGVVISKPYDRISKTTGMRKTLKSARKTLQYKCVGSREIMACSQSITRTFVDEEAKVAMVNLLAHTARELPEPNDARNQILSLRGQIDAKNDALRELVKSVKGGMPWAMAEDSTRELNAEIVELQARLDVVIGGNAHQKFLLDVVSGLQDATAAGAIDDQMDLSYEVLTEFEALPLETQRVLVRSMLHIKVMRPIKGERERRQRVIITPKSSYTVPIEG